MDILTVDNITKVYGVGERAVRALDRVSFTVKKGQFVAIIGPSGSGKSTLLHIMAGVESPTAGHILIDGIDISSLTEEERAIFRRRQIGLVYQFNNLVSVLNVKENVGLPMSLDSREIDEERCEKLLLQLGVAGKKDAFPEQLSGGQQQRVAIARALFNAPAIVLADEPTGNLDSQSSQDVLELLKDSNRRFKQTMIVITHNEDIALQADRIITIDDGKLVNDQVVR